MKGIIMEIMYMMKTGMQNSIKDFICLEIKMLKIS